MRLLKTLPARKSSAATVLEGVLAETSSGNHCRFWPAITRDAATKETRVAFFIEWRCMATPDDIAELTALTDEIMGGTPAFFTDGIIDPWTNEENLEWLRSGKTPPPKRAN
jgi:hypothetical protein